MAIRPIFVPMFTDVGVLRMDVDFKWFPGVSIQQKQRSIFSLHTEAIKNGINHVLEISTKSNDKIGVELSAFNLTIEIDNKIKYPVELAFQSSKVFKNGGPYIDILNKTPRDAKRDLRLKSSGDLIGFQFHGTSYSINPINFFYNWLYVNALHQNKKLSSELLKYDAFSDIEFNQKKSLNCQAMAAALYVSLVKNDQLSFYVNNVEHFKLLHEHIYSKCSLKIPIQLKLV